MLMLLCFFFGHVLSQVGDNSINSEFIVQQHTGGALEGREKNDMVKKTSDSDLNVYCDKSQTTYLSQADAKKAIKSYVEEQTNNKLRPRFVPTVNALMEAALTANANLLTFQLGGMDDKSGDAFFSHVNIP